MAMFLRTWLRLSSRNMGEPNKQTATNIMPHTELNERLNKENKEKDIALFRAIGNGYVNQAILFNAGFTFDEVQAIKNVFTTK